MAHSRSLLFSLIVTLVGGEWASDSYQSESPSEEVNLLQLQQGFHRLADEPCCDQCKNKKGRKAKKCRKKCGDCPAERQNSPDPIKDSPDPNLPYPPPCCKGCPSKRKGRTCRKQLKKGHYPDVWHQWEVEGKCAACYGFGGARFRDLSPCCYTLICPTHDYKVTGPGDEDIVMVPKNKFELKCQPRWDRWKADTICAPDHDCSLEKKTVTKNGDATFTLTERFADLHDDFCCACAAHNNGETVADFWLTHKHFTPEECSWCNMNYSPCRIPGKYFDDEKRYWED